MGYDLYSATKKLTEQDHQRILDEVIAEHCGREVCVFGLPQVIYDALAATGAYFRFAQVAWPKLFALAFDHGWQPEREADYYRPNGGQEVSAQDAARMADALESALPTLRAIAPLQSAVTDDPDKMDGFGKYIGKTLPAGVTMIAPRGDLSPEAFWACAPDKVERFIAFARTGAFTIH